MNKRGGKQEGLRERVDVGDIAGRGVIFVVPEDPKDNEQQVVPQPPIDVRWQKFIEMMNA